MEDKVKKREISPYEIMGYVVIVLGAVLILVGMVLFKFIGSSSSSMSVLEVERFGQFGQFIGGVVGSIWALAGVLLFFATLNYQKKEFEQQRVELEKTQKIFKQQDFSSLFINIISHHTTYINSLVAWGEDDSSWKGVNFFALFKQKVIKSFADEMQISTIHKNDLTSKDLFCKAFTEQYNNYQHELEPYFKNMKLLFDMVHKYRNETLDKGDYYTQIIKSSISANELFLIYHVAAFNLFTDLKKYHRVFNLFEYLDHDSRVEYIVEKKSKTILPLERREMRTDLPATDESTLQSII